MKPFEIFAVTVPGMEATLRAEAIEAGFTHAKLGQGGVTFMGHWTSVWRANLLLRGATRILARIGQFRVYHLAELDRLARDFPWEDTLKPGQPVKVEVTTKASKIYHQRAAAERFEKAISTLLRAPISNDAAVALKIRIDKNICTISVDTSGDPLHKRGSKTFIGKAPMRETLAALFLRQAGFTGTTPVFDPMCGSGTFVLEAAEIAKGLAPGRNRDFAFMRLASFQQDRWQAIRSELTERETNLVFSGSDRDSGVIQGAKDNAARAGLSDITTFENHSISNAAPPPGPSGLVMINPPYGDRIGNKRHLFGLYGALGKTLKAQFPGWQAGLVTSDALLAKATGLSFKSRQGPVSHGGIGISLYLTDPL